MYSGAIVLPGSNNGLHARLSVDCQDTVKMTGGAGMTELSTCAPGLRVGCVGRKLGKAVVVARGTPLPERLRNDAIVEALLEIQFETGTLPERFIGRMTDSGPWKDVEQRYLPAHQLPPSVRQMDPITRVMPTIEMSFTGDEPRLLRVGPNVVSYHRAKKYVGWETFKLELDSTIDYLFAAAESVRITRLGLRYLNAVNPALHGIRSVADLDLAISVAGEGLNGDVNLNFIVDLGATGKCTVRVATRGIIQGPLPENTSAYIDIDVYTDPGFGCTSAVEAKEWIVVAHEREKTEFFHLFTQATIDLLKET